MGRKFMSLPGEVSGARALEKSAETIVALMSRESRGGAKGRRTERLEEGSGAKAERNENR
jgi:hypothetical protein